MLAVGSYMEDHFIWKILRGILSKISKNIFKRKRILRGSKILKVFKVGFQNLTFYLAEVGILSEIFKIHFKKEGLRKALFS